MKQLSKREVDRLARELWQQREQAVSMLMQRMHGIKNYETMPWERAPKRGRDLLRRHAEALYYHGRPNDWMQVDPKWLKSQ